MKRSKLSIFFYGKKSSSATSTLLIFARVSIDRDKYVFSIQRKISSNDWDQSRQRAKPKSRDAFIVNNQIDSVRSEIFEAHRILSDRSIYVTIAILKEKQSNKEDEEKFSFSDFYVEYIERKKELLGVEITSATFEKENRIHKKFLSFLEYKKLASVSFKELNNDLGKDFFNYMKTIDKLSHNTAVKNLHMFKSVIRDAVNKGHIPIDPMREIKVSVKEKPRQYLIMDEINALEKLDKMLPRLELVRDIFVFSCYTGLAYIDVKQLTTTNIRKGLDDKQWIFTSRQKTDVKSNIPLLPKAQAIIEKYKPIVSIKNDNRLLPILSNQKMNSYLKELADRAGISKVLTFHIARHSFATTITLANGVPIESVSKMLGHTSMKTTQHYAKVVDQKVSDDMKALQKKLNQ